MRPASGALHIGRNRNRDEALLAATAQAWVIIARMANEEPVDGFPTVRDPDQLRAVLDSDHPPGTAAASQTTDKLIATGDTGIEAIDALLPRLKQDGNRWDITRVKMSMIEIATFHELSRPDAYRKAERAFIDEFGGQVGVAAHGRSKDVSDQVGRAREWRIQSGIVACNPSS